MLGGRKNIKQVLGKGVFAFFKETGEIFETRPGLTDSGGAGEWRGGLSLQREYEMLEHATIVRRFDKARFPPEGLAGGRPGTAARFVTRLGTAEERERPPGRYDMQPGERFLLQSAGGGGYGDPQRRDPAALARDLAEGYVTASGAKRDYGR